MLKSYTSRLFDGASFVIRNFPDDPVAIKRGIKIGFFFLMIFMIWMMIYKIYFPHLALFLVSLVSSIIGISAFFINLLASFYVKHGLEPGVIAYLLMIVIFATSIFLPIVIKIYL